MTLRDYFAAKVAQGLMVNCDMKTRHAAYSEAEQVAATAYAIADAMLKARDA